jgi:hypothetical protein
MKTRKTRKNYKKKSRKTKKWIIFYKFLFNLLLRRRTKLQCLI